MKIALAYNEVLPPHRYGGVERVVMNLAKHYRLLGHSVFILAAKGSKLPEYEHAFFAEDWDGADISHLLPKDIDLIHFHQPPKEKPQKPHLITIHGNAQPGEVFFANTNFVSQSHAQNHNAKYFVLQAIDIERFPFVEKKSDYYIFMAKAKWRVKNLKTCLDFCRDLKVPMKVVGGTGTNKNGIEYLGLLGDHEGRLELLANARGLLYPTNWDEPCALAPLEAMACGTPVIGSYNGSMPEEVLPGTGFLAHTYEEMCAAHKKIDTINAKECRAITEKHFSAQRQAGDYIKLMQLVLEKGELDQSPRYNFKKSSINYLYKSTLLNNLIYAVRRKI